MTLKFKLFKISTSLLPIITIQKIILGFDFELILNPSDGNFTTQLTPNYDHN